MEEIILLFPCQENIYPSKEIDSFLDLVRISTSKTNNRVFFLLKFSPITPASSYPDREDYEDERKAGHGSIEDEDQG